MSNTNKISVLKLISVGSSVLQLIEDFQSIDDDGKIEPTEIIGVVSSIVAIVETLGIDVSDDIQEALASGDVESLLVIVVGIIDRLKPKV